MSINRLNSLGTIPAIQRITKNTKTVIHIGWKDENSTFCLCGQDNNINKTTRESIDISYDADGLSNYWTNRRDVEKFPRITCKKCIDIWISNIIRNVDTMSVKAYVLSRIERKHIASNVERYSGGYNSMVNPEAFSTKEEYKLEENQEIITQDRLLKSGWILHAIVTNSDDFVHLAAITDEDEVVTICDHKLGTLIKDYEPLRKITCPKCIEYIKTYDLDVDKEEMNDRIDRLMGNKINMKKYEEWAQEFQNRTKKYQEDIKRFQKSVKEHQKLAQKERKKYEELLPYVLKNVVNK